MGGTITVEMGETRVARAAGERLVALGLGACIGLCVYDPLARIAALVHIVLPQTLPLSPPSKAAANYFPPLGRCADTAVAHVVEQITREGALRSRLCAAMAGGSHIFSHSTGSDAARSRLEIGPRNVEAARAALDALGVPLLADDVGGTCGRTLTVCTGTGDVYVRRIGSEERLLVSLGLCAPPVTATPVKEALRYAC